MPARPAGLPGGRACTRAGGQELRDAAQRAVPVQGVAAGSLLGGRAHGGQEARRLLAALGRHLPARPVPARPSRGHLEQRRGAARRPSRRRELGTAVTRAAGQAGAARQAGRGVLDAATGPMEAGAAELRRCNWFFFSQPEVCRAPRWVSGERRSRSIFRWRRRRLGEAGAGAGPGSAARGPCCLRQLRPKSTGRSRRTGPCQPPPPPPAGRLCRARLSPPCALDPGPCGPGPWALRPAPCALRWGAPGGARGRRRNYKVGGSR